MAPVGGEIKRLREAKGWTQPRLAVEAGVAVSAVSQIENGRRSPNVGTLEKLAAALEVEVADIFREPASRLAGGPPAQATEASRAGQQERIEKLYIYRDIVVAAVDKLAEVFEDAKAADDEVARLWPLHLIVTSTRVGLAESLKEKEAMQPREGESQHERGARETVWRALSEFDDLAEDIAAADMVDAYLKSKPGSVIDIAESRRRRAIG